MLQVQQLYSDIEQLLEQKERVILAIDGMSGAGKSSFANQLVDWFAAKQVKCNIIHMDYFFLRPEQRTPQRLSMPGGNIDFERFNDEVAMHLTSGEPFTYRPFDCKTQTFATPVIVEPTPLTVVEGVYSMHPEIISNNIYDITVFMRLDEDEQKRRLKERNPELYERFLSEWIPMESKYFEAFNVREKCTHNSPPLEG
ncbi:MAG: hypothetical protein FWD44_09275 [Oscillospiraceae bacterium]|nr:hypothetical protein [Oscillospiraceae bacterium]